MIDKVFGTLKLIIAYIALLVFFFGGISYIALFNTIELVTALAVIFLGLLYAGYLIYSGLTQLRRRPVSKPIIIRVGTSANFMLGCAYIYFWEPKYLVLLGVVLIVIGAQEMTRLRKLTAERSN